MRAFHCDEFDIPLPAGHRFPMAKYRLLRERVVRDGLVAPGRLLVPDAADDATLALAHDPAYVERVARGTLSQAEVRALGLPWSEGLVERSRRSVGGTVAAARACLEDGVGASLAGGTHHASRSRGQGFCVFNDVAVAIRAVQHEGRIRRAVVVDLDVHQGDGTASLFEGDDDVFTLSVHGARNFPLRKERSDLDVELADGTGDDEYLDRLVPALEHAFAAARAEIAFYVAGADPLAGDRLGRLALTAAGLAARDEAVLGRCARLGLPVAVVMAGGYAPRIEDSVAVHAATIAIAARHASR